METTRSIIHLDEEKELGKETRKNVISFSYYYSF